MKFFKSKGALLCSVLLITFICYLPCLDNEFVNWDDNVYIYENEAVTGFEVDNPLPALKKMFTQEHNSIYAPFTTLSFALEKEVFGLDNPSYWHLDNVILHLIIVVICFYIGIELGLAPIYAALLALLFGIHPMRVESVAWLTERKDVLYGLFYFLALFFYIRMRKKEFSYGRTNKQLSFSYHYPQQSE